MKKRFFYSHPILGGLIALVLVTIICNAIGAVVQIGAAIVDMVSSVRAGELVVDTKNADQVLGLIEAYLDTEPGQNVYNSTVAISALLCVPVFCWMNRKNGYLGPFRIHGTQLKDVKIFIAVFVALDVISELLALFTMPGGFPKLSISAGMIVLALYAGINEEIIDRAITAAVMMRNKPTSRRILATVLLTSLLFGVSHIVNLLAGQDLVATLVQMVFAACAGLFFIGIYLRTGSIALTIVIHALHDLMVFIINSLPEVETTFLLSDVLAIIVNFLPIVFGILMLLPKHHAAIIETWTRIWPEKNMPAAEAVNE